MLRKRKVGIFLTILLRGLLGSIGIIFFNEWMILQEMSCQIGLNPISVLVIIFLGFPGFIMLCALNFI